MPATTVSNPRDLLVQLLGELLFVERRLADDVLERFARSISDGELRDAVMRHRAETAHHVERIEAAFRRMTLAPTSNLSRPFESAVGQHDELQATVTDPTLADLFHAQAALHTEHWEIAAYTAVIALGDAAGQGAALEPLGESLREEEHARSELAEAIARLASDARA